MSKNLDDFALDSNRFPKRIELQLPPDLADWLQRTSAATGRSEAELLLELLDRGLQQF
jgi:predicted DNA-binding protein